MMTKGTIARASSPRNVLSLSQKETSFRRVRKAAEIASMRRRVGTPLSVSPTRMMAASTQPPR